MLDDPTAWLFTDNDGRTSRVIVTALAALFLFRWLYLLGRRPMTTPAAPLSPLVPPSSPAAPAPARSWWPTKKQRLVEAIELVALKTDGIVAETVNTKATAELHQARRELADLRRRIDELIAFRLEEKRP